jgi:hypothetical protein
MTHDQEKRLQVLEEKIETFDSLFELYLTHLGTDIQMVIDYVKDTETSRIKNVRELEKSIRKNLRDVRAYTSEVRKKLSRVH